MFEFTRSILPAGLLIALLAPAPSVAQVGPDAPTTPAPNTAGPVPIKKAPAKPLSILEKLTAISEQTDWLKASELAPVAQKLANEDTVLYPDGPLPGFSAADLARWKIGGKWSWRGHSADSEPLPVVFTLEGATLVLTRGRNKRYLGGEADKNGVLVLEHRSPKAQFPPGRERLVLTLTPEGRLEGFFQGWSGDDTDPTPVRIYR